MICDKEDIETIKNNKRTIKVPHSVDCLQGILSVIPLQLLAFHLAVLRGYDVSYSSSEALLTLPIPNVFSSQLTPEVQSLTSGCDVRGLSGYGKFLGIS